MIRFQFHLISIILFGLNVKYFVLTCEMHISHTITQNNNDSYKDLFQFGSNFSVLNNIYVNHNSTEQIRNKRSVSLERHLELLVAYDSSLFEYHGDLLEQYLLTLISMVNKSRLLT